MTILIKCLVSGETLLGVASIVEVGDLFYCNNGHENVDVIISKLVFPSAEIVYVEVPEEFNLTDYFKYKYLDLNLVSIDMPVQAKTRNQYIEERTELVNSIKVTVGDKVFDGDENSQSRMLRQIQVFDITATDSVIWTLANNDNVMVFANELKEALSLAVQEQARLWPIPEEAI